MANLSKKEKEVLEKPYGLLTDKEWAVLNKLYNQEGIYKMTDETIKVLQKEQEKAGKNK